MDGNKIVISLPGGVQPEVADHDHPSEEEMAKIKNILTAMGEAEGVAMPYGIVKKISSVYLDIKDFVDREDIDSIDRIDSERGYSKDNIIMCELYVNVFRGKLSRVDFLNLCKEIADKHSNDKLEGE
ncbi:MAG: hypothetical protein WC455_20170 [Dehalococcoidia bacterium]|jgi:hypothetical protein